MVKKVAWLIFIRANSSRLKNKCYLDLKGLNTLQRITNSALKNGIDSKDIFLCTSNDNSCDEITAIGKKLFINVLRGPENHPLERILSINAKRELAKYDYFVRICGDSPFYPFFLVKKVIYQSQNDLNNIFSITNVRLRNFPRGMSIEIYNKSKIEDLLERNKSLSKIEHMSELITKYKPNNYKVIDITTEFNLLEILPNKLTLDTYEDYKKLNFLLENNFEAYFEKIITKTKLDIKISNF